MEKESWLARRTRELVAESCRRGCGASHMRVLCGEGPRTAVAAEVRDALSKAGAAVVEVPARGDPWGPGGYAERSREAERRAGPVAVLAQSLEEVMEGMERQALSAMRATLQHSGVESSRPVLWVALDAAAAEPGEPLERTYLRQAMTPVDARPMEG